MNPPVVLASASPRRRDLLRRIGIEPIVVPADVDETPLPEETPVVYVERLARAKAAAVDVPAGHLVVAADTTVDVDGVIFGKPVDDGDARSMLRRLSGRSHRVHTGVAMRSTCRGDTGSTGSKVSTGDTVSTEATVSTVATTVVHVGELDEELIDAYVAGGEPRGKAGAYAIQGAGGMFVDAIEGSDTNVVGLPLPSVVALAARLGVRLLPR